MSLRTQGATGHRLSLGRRVVALAERATTPLLPADYLDLFHPLRRGAALRGRIVAVHPETRDAATIEIRTGADWAGHVPGQYVRVGVDVDGVRQWRAYSLTHGPRDDGRITITVKAVAGGTVSEHLVHRSHPGTLVHLEQAAGDFVLPPTGGKFLFVTAGSGITPVIGMLRNLFPVTDAGVLRPARSLPYDVVVLHIAPSEADSIFLDNLRELHAAGLITLVSRPTDEHGRLDVSALAALVPDVEERTTLACGPPALLDALQRHCDNQGLALLTERFRAERTAVGDGGTVTFARTGAAVPTGAGTSILDAAEDAGVLMPSGCRMGICYGCVLPLRSGAVRDLRTGDLTTATPGETAGRGVPVQTCVSAPAGACEVDH
jgi:ferredoxin-NADP reductase